MKKKGLKQVKVVKKKIFFFKKRKGNGIISKGLQ